VAIPAGGEFCILASFSYSNCRVERESLSRVFEIVWIHEKAILIKHDTPLLSAQLVIHIGLETPLQPQKLVSLMYSGSTSSLVSPDRISHHLSLNGCSQSLRSKSPRHPTPDPCAPNPRHTQRAPRDFSFHTPRVSSVRGWTAPKEKVPDRNWAASGIGTRIQKCKAREEGRI
jgi:hypothetical protein